MIIALGFDLGTTTLGVSKLDDLGIVSGVENFSYPSLAYIRPRNRAKELIDEYGVNTVVVGLPTNMDGTDSAMTRAARIFAERLKLDTPNLNVILENEICSTFEAYDLMDEAGIKKENQQDYVDMYAAIVILKQYASKRSK